MLAARCGLDEVGAWLVSRRSKTLWHYEAYWVLNTNVILSLLWSDGTLYSSLEVSFKQEAGGGWCLQA